MIEYHSDLMPLIPNMYDIKDLFANFANNWYHLRFVLSLLFGISFGFFLIRKILEGGTEIFSVLEGMVSATFRATRITDNMKHKASVAAEISKEKASAAAERAKEKLEQYGDNQLRRMELRHEAKMKFRDQMDAMKDEQKNAVVFLAALAVRKEKTG
jgi:uncharacterized membrane protein